MIRKNPNPKYDYMRSKRNAMQLVYNIKDYWRDRGYHKVDVWAESESLTPHSEIWVVRSNVAREILPDVQEDLIT